MRKFVVGIVIVLVVLAAVGGYLFLKPKNTIPPGKVFRVGVLSGLSFFATTFDGFKDKMTELGYIEGKNIIYDVQKSEVDLAVYRQILKKFVADKVDLIFVFPTEASIEAKAAVQGTNIPVVFTNAFTDDTGLVDSVRHPGGNITGVRWVGPDLALQRLEIMHELVPSLKQLWVPYFKDYPIVKSQIAALRLAVAKTGITMTEIPATTATELTASLNTHAKSGLPDAILVISEPLLVIPDAFVAAARFAAQHAIPLGGAYMLVGDYESLFGVTPQSVPQGKQAALLADKILRGTPAGTIPVVSAEGYFQMSFRAANKLGLPVPEGLLNRANEIIR
jgi:putative ABC transport system substrate-binding protein